MNPKRLVVALATASALVLPASAQAAGYQDAVLADSPLTYLRLDESLGTVAEDASPNNRDGAYAGGVTLGGVAPFVDAVNAPAFATSGTVTAGVDQVSRTLELWVNPNRLSRGQQAGIVAHGNPAVDGWSIGLGARRKLAVVTGGSTAQTKITLASNAWTLVTVTWSDKVRVYINGALKKTLNGDPATGSGALVLGGNGAGAFSGSFSGSLDEAALYSTALSAAAIQAHSLAAHVPINTTLPSITGTPAVGNTLTVQPGVWTDAATATRTYQWQRCDSNGEDCGDIDGATGTTYQVTVADACSTLQVVETVTNASGGGTAISDPTSQAVPCLPSNTVLPTVTGTPAVGETLTANAGTWSDAAGAPRTYQWLRCDANGDNCADIAGETGTSYVLGAADECMTVQVAETVTNASGPATAGSAPTDKVGPCTTPDPEPTPEPTPDPTPEPTPDPTPEPTPEPTTEPTPDPGTSTSTGTGTDTGATTGTTVVSDPVVGAEVTANAGTAGCLRLVAGPKRKRLRPLGVLRLTATKNACVTAPIKATVKPRKGTTLKSVRYMLDGKLLKRVKRLKFGAKLRPAKLAAGTHTVRVRVTPRVGKAKTFKLRLRLAVA